MRRHPLFFGGGDIPGGMSAGERQDLLTFENDLAKERDEKARQFQLESERRREAQETELRKQTELTEKQRLAELERMEQAGIDAAESGFDVIQSDKDQQVVNMWTALSAGTRPEDITTTQNLPPSSAPTLPNSQLPSTTDRPS
tara:strand:- start:2469 stop:2897 length:429 start_codon:yes stop_codon:yes gene_type:complete